MSEEINDVLGTHKQNGWVGVIVLLAIAGVGVAGLYYGVTHLDLSTSTQASPTPKAQPTNTSISRPSPVPTAAATPTATFAPSAAPTVPAIQPTSTSQPKGKKDTDEPPVYVGG